MPLGLSGSGLITGFDPTASGFGKVLQVVRATDTTSRTTTSATPVDVGGMSVTISPTKTTSAVLILCSVKVRPASSAFVFMTITDSSNNSISGSEQLAIGANNMGTGDFMMTSVAYATPATTSPRTYKLRFAVSGGTGTIKNDENTGQIYAIEVAA